MRAGSELDLEELEDQLAALPPNYVRIKGIVRTVDARGGDAVHGWTAIHRVGLRVSSEPMTPPEGEQGRIVALGQGLDAGALTACITAAEA